MQATIIFQTKRVGEEKAMVVVRDQDLTHTLFANKKFENYIFSNCNLMDTDWTNTELYNCKFRNCQMASIDFTGSILEDILFHKCSCASINFSHTHIFRPMFSMSYFRGAIFDKADIPFFHAYFPNFEEVDFTTANITDTFALVGNFKNSKALPNQGFRVKKGG
jgi:uncharacterized protein YjbI with pentapeptide repeats